MAPVTAAGQTATAAADEWVDDKDNQSADSSDWIDDDGTISPSTTAPAAATTAQKAWDRLHDPHNDLLHNALGQHRAFDLRKKTAKVTPARVRENEGGLLDFITGGAEQLGITPTTIAETKAQFSPTEQFVRAGKAAIAGKGGEAFRRTVQGSLGPIGGMIVPPSEHLLSDPYEEHQRAAAISEQNARSGVTPPEFDMMGNPIITDPRQITPLAHEAAALVPVFGHQAAEIGESFGHGRDAHAAGRATALVAPFIAGGVLGKTDKATPTTPAEAAPITPGDTTAATTAATSDLPKVRRTVAESGGSKTAEVAEHLLERSLPGSLVFRQFRKAAIEDVQRLADAVVSKISQYKGRPEELGRHVQESIDLGRKQAGEEATRLRTAVDDTATPTRVIRKETKVTNHEIDTGIVDEKGNKITRTEPRTTTTSRIVADEDSGAWVDYSALKSFVPDIKRLIDDPYRVIADPERTRLADLSSRIEKGSDHVPWDTAVRDRQTLQNLLKDTKNLDLTAHEQPLRATQASIHEAIDSAMEDSLTRHGGWELADQWRSAESLSRANKETFIQSVIGKLQGKVPEQVPDILRTKSTGLDEIRAIKTYVGPEMFNAMVGKVMGDIMKESIDSLRNKPDVQYLNPQTLANKIEQLSRNGRLSELVSPEIEAQLAHLVHEARATKLPRGIDISLINSPINAGIGAEALIHGVIHTGLGAAVPASAAFGASMGLAYLLTHPAGISAIRAALRQSAVASAGVAEAATATERPNEHKHATKQSTATTRNALP